MANGTPWIVSLIAIAGFLVVVVSIQSNQKGFAKSVEQNQLASTQKQSDNFSDLKASTAKGFIELKEQVAKVEKQVDGVVERLNKVVEAVWRIESKLEKINKVASIPVTNAISGPQ